MKLSKKNIIIGSVALAVIVGGSSAYFIPKANKNKIETQTVEKCTITQIVEASGTINPVNTVSVGSTVSGLIKEIYVDFNSEVKKGQILAQIDPANFEATVQQNMASISNASANLARLQAEADMYKKTYTRYKNLYARNFIAKSELDQAESNYKANLAQMSAARAQITQAQAQYKTATTNLGYTKIIAPVDGTVISRKIDLGQPVAASFQAPELFTIAQDLTKMKIEVSVSEADIGKVKEGQDVIYTLDGYPDEKFEGKVTQVRLSSTTVSNVVTYTVIVNVDNKDLKLKPGMTANVSIITEKSEDVVCIPSIAMKYVPVKKNGEIKRYEDQGVWVMRKNQPTRVKIETGANDDIFTEIKSGDIKVGDKVIIGTSSNKGEKDGKRKMRMF